MALSVHTFNSHDGNTIAYYKNTPENESKAVMLITHGMAEHAKRYNHFAEFLNQNGFVVYAHDQRGHGETAGKIEKIGHFADKNGWQKVSDDLAEMVKIAKNENKGLPIFVFGHSMGSFVTRTYLIQHSEDVNGAILSGTAGSAGILGFVGNIIASVIMIFKRKTAPSPLMNQLSFGSFNKAFKPNRTDFDWLSRDEKLVDKYVADPFCGTIFSIRFFKDLINGLEYVNKLKNAEKIRKDIPLYLFSGKKDPVSKNGKQVSDVFNMYKKAGIKDVEMKIYPEARHETLNEINKEDVYNDILNWLNNKIS